MKNDLSQIPLFSKKNFKFLLFSKKNLQRTDPRSTDPEKTWVSNRSVTSLGGSVTSLVSGLDVPMIRKDKGLERAGNAPKCWHGLLGFFGSPGYQPTFWPRSKKPWPYFPWVILVGSSWDPYVMVYEKKPTVYNWVVFHPLHNLPKQGLFHCSLFGVRDTYR